MSGLSVSNPSLTRQRWRLFTVMITVDHHRGAPVRREFFCGPDSVLYVLQLYDSLGSLILSAAWKVCIAVSVSSWRSGDTGQLSARPSFSRSAKAQSPGGCTWLAR